MFGAILQLANGSPLIHPSQPPSFVLPRYRKIPLAQLFDYPLQGTESKDLAFYWKGGIRSLGDKEEDLGEADSDDHAGESGLETGSSTSTGT